MANVHVTSVSKHFENTVAVDNLSLEVANGELVSLLGPSGCGKTTTLRMVAGFIEPTSGRVAIGESTVSDPEAGVFIAPEQRKLGMVFQSYAVWPHMTVFHNIAYPLRVRKVKRSELEKRVHDVAGMVQMGPLLNRYPNQLSGGQQQRVALARALVAEPRVLLLDEPLSNLDAKLREEMRIEIKELQRKLGITIFFVTHDQVEAMVLSDRIAVMNEGRLLQVGSPREIYEHPADEFVARFIGAANILNVDPSGGCVAGDPEFELPVDVASGSAVVRPENVEITYTPGPGRVAARVRTSLYMGDEQLCFLERGDHNLVAKLPSNATPARDDELYLRITEAAVVSSEGGR